MRGTRCRSPPPSTATTSSRLRRSAPPTEGSPHACRAAAVHALSGAARADDGRRAARCLDLLGHGIDRALDDRAAAAADDRHARQFTTRLLRAAGPVSAARLREALRSLPPSVRRAKGFVRLDDAPDAWQLLQVVGARWSLVPAPSCPAGGASTLVVMGAADALDEASLSRLAAVFAPLPRATNAYRSVSRAPAAHGR
jgi:G3E family GTPase